MIEKCPNSSFSLKMIELDSEWSDLGTWNSIWDISAKDSYGNSAKGDVLSYKSHNNFIFSSGRLIALIDVNDLAVIETPDAILVSNRKNNLDVKFVVEDLLKNKREEVFAHRKIMRPWGWFDLIDSGDQFKVKRIQV